MPQATTLVLALLCLIFTTTTIALSPTSPVTTPASSPPTATLPPGVAPVATPLPDVTLTPTASHPVASPQAEVPAPASVAPTPSKGTTTTTPAPAPALTSPLASPSKAPAPVMNNPLAPPSKAPTPVSPSHLAPIHAETPAGVGGGDSPAHDMPIDKSGAVTVTLGMGCAAALVFGFFM